MTKQTIATVVAAASLAGGFGYSLGSAAAPQPADAASSNADVVRQLKALDAHVVAQLKRTNGQLAAVNAGIGSQKDQGTVRWLLTTICNYTASVDCG